MTKFFIAGILLFLLLGAGYGLSQAARTVPWDCSDWQAFAHADRDISILESLAENRGKTLYCGIDQSDTFAKAETWEAGRDHNERDDTVYYGERGRFRGFIAAQEGWLTDGESGITGQSIAVIFEFPQEPPRRTRRTKRLAVGTDPEQFPINAEASCGQVGGIICSRTPGPAGPFATGTNQRAQAVRRARFFHAFNQVTYGSEPPNSDWRINWETQVISWIAPRADRATLIANPGPAEWAELAQDAALRACRARGYQRAIKVAIGPGHSENLGNTDPDHAQHTGTGLGWFYGDNMSPPNHRYAARQSRT